MGVLYDLFFDVSLRSLYRKNFDVIFFSRNMDTMDKRKDRGLVDESLPVKITGNNLPFSRYINIYHWIFIFVFTYLFFTKDQFLLKYRSSHVTVWKLMERNGLYGSKLVSKYAFFPSVIWYMLNILNEIIHEHMSKHNPLSPYTVPVSWMHMGMKSYVLTYVSAWFHLRL